MASDLRRLGSVVSDNNSIMMVIGDAEVAARWGGDENGVADLEPEGSDWELCFNALNGEIAEWVAPVTFEGGELLAVSIDDGGWVNVVQVEAGIILVEHSYSDIAGDPSEPAYEGMFRDADFLDWLTSPFDADAPELGRFRIHSGTMGILPSPVPGTEIKEDGLLVSLPAGDYVVRMDGAMRHDTWGAARALIEPR